ncbi:MAG: lipase/acyltransferase domain-containing protein [Pseudonocardiaceae bacterium]
MAERQHLIVVLPGIGGSVLARPGKPDDVVWDAGKGDIADLIFRSDRMSVAEAPRLEPLGLTESTKFMAFTVVPGYEKLLDQLTAFGVVDRRGDPQRPEPSANVVAVPYDFRHGIVAAAERLDAVVCAHLAGASQAERAGRVIVVAHSMGGLVARVWMGLLGRWPWCRSLITLGAPHRGAPKALDWLVNGVLLKGPTEMLRGWPSLVELLPRYPAVRNTAVDAPDAALYPFELPIPWLSARARAAYDLHVAIEKGWGDMPRRGPETVACIGWSHRTLDAAFWNGARLRVTKDQPDWLGLQGWDKDFGDGTVPSFSALPPEMDNHEHSPIRLAQRHVPLAHAAVVVDLLRRLLNRRPPSKIHGAEGGEHPPTLGLDLDELHAAGTPIRVTAALREVDADVSGQRVWARLRPVRGRRVDVPLSWYDGLGCFVGELPGQAPGLYEVRVSAREVPRAGDLVAADTVAVVEGG